IRRRRHRPRHGGHGAKLRHDRAGRAGGIHDGRAGEGAGAVLRGRGKGEGGNVSGALKLGTRGSKLALWQAEWVGAALARHGTATELVVIATRGDADVDPPVQQRFLDLAREESLPFELVERRIDVAV